MKKEGGINTSKIIIFAIVLTLIGGLIVLGISVLPALFEDAFGVNGGGGDGDGDGEGPDEDEAPPLEYQIESFALDKAAGRATVGVRAYGACRVIVRFATEESYFESTPLLGITYIDALSVTADIEIPKTEPKTEFVAEEITLDVTGELPLHFVAEAVLIDENGNELSARSVDVTNTERFDKFVNTKPEDFPEGSCVLSFDESGCDNFGVLADGVKSITAESISGVILEEDEDGFIDTYIIERPSETVAVGDRLYATDGTNEIILKVASVSYDGDIATVSAARAETDGFTITDFYKFIKADMELYDPSAKGEAVPLSATDEDGEDRGEFSKSYSIGRLPFKLEFGDSLSADCCFENVVLGVKAYYVYAPSIFGDEYFECEMRAKASMRVNVDLTLSTGNDGYSAEGSFNLKDKEKFASIPIPTPIVGVNLKAEFSKLLSYSLAATVGINDVPLNVDIGFKYNSVGGFASVGNGVKIGGEGGDWLELSGEISLTFGPVVSLGIEFISGLFTVEVSGAYGIQLKAHTTLVGGAWDHRCAFCVDGHVDFLYTVNAAAKMGLFGIAKLTLKEVEIVDESVLDVYTFYISKKDEKSPLEIKEGTCPNWYKIIELDSYCDANEYFTCYENYVEDDGSYIFQEEYRDGVHKHYSNKAYIVITNPITGEVYYDNTLYTTYDKDSQGRPQYSTHPHASTDSLSVPIGLKEIHFRIEFECNVVECARTTGVTGGDFETTNPERIVKHVVEGTIINDSVYCRECNRYVRGPRHEEIIFITEKIDGFRTVHMDSDDWGQHDINCSKYKAQE